jgi:4-hydroxy-4-methyl-2-oxoglutarate aldolase
MSPPMPFVSILDRLASLDTNTVSDALDFLELPGATYGLLPLWDCPKIVGRASTIQLGPKINAKPTVHLIASVIDAVTTDDRILVIAGGVEGISCWGDIIADAAIAKQIRGSVIDGMSRDIEGSEAIGYPVYGRGVTMVSARNRVVQIDSGKPVQLTGVTVHQDDYVIAARCGAVFIRADHIDDVLALGERIALRQDGMVAAVRSGRSVAEVMHDREFEATNRRWWDTFDLSRFSREPKSSQRECGNPETGLASCSLGPTQGFRRVG